jgi:hypothetical protein
VPIWLWLMTGALALVAGALVVLKLLMRGQIFLGDGIYVDGFYVIIGLFYGSKLPKLFKVGATTIGYDIYFRTYPRSLGITVNGRPPISRHLAAHEVFHVVDRERRGWFGYWKRVLWQTALHPFNHDARPYEQEAENAAPLIMSGFFPGIDARTFLNRFN